MKRASLSLLILILTIGFFLPSFTLFTNNQSFPTQHFDILKLLPIYGIGLFLLLLIPLYFVSRTRPHRLSDLANLLLLVNILIVIEAYFLNWNLGILDGSELGTNNYVLKVILDFIVWILVSFLFFKNKLFESNVFLNTLLLGIQVSFVLTSYFNQAFLYPDFSLERKNKFHLSKKQNVLILTLDGFQSNLFNEILENRPEIKDYLKDFTYFQNSLSNYSQTVDSVTSFLTESYPNEKIPRKLFMYNELRKRSISTTLKQHGFRAELHPWGIHEVYCDATICDNWLGFKLPRKQRSIARFQLADLTIYRIAPLIFKKQFFFGTTGPLENFFKEESPIVSENNIKVPTRLDSNQGMAEKFTSSSFLKNLRLTTPLHEFPPTLHDGTRSTNFHSFLRDLKSNSRARWETPVFKYLHHQGLHTPQNTDKDLNYAEWPRSQRAVYEQAIAALRVAVLFITQLQELEVYDNSLIFIISDHGYGKDGISVGSRDKILDENQVDLLHKSRAIPLILVKRFGETKKEMNVSQAPVMLTDIPKTIVDELGISTNLYKQVSFFKLPEDSVRRRTTFNFNHITDSRGYLQEKFEYFVEGHSWDNSSWHNAQKK